MKPKMKRRNIMITEPLDELLIQEARITGLSMSDIVRRALEDYIAITQASRNATRAALGYPKQE